jgi:hypothetical protein
MAPLIFAGAVLRVPQEFDVRQQSGCCLPTRGSPGDEGHVSRRHGARKAARRTRRCRPRRRRAGRVRPLRSASPADCMSAQQHLRPGGAPWTDESPSWIEKVRTFIGGDVLSHLIPRCRLPVVRTAVKQSSNAAEWCGSPRRAMESNSRPAAPASTREPPARAAPPDFPSRQRRWLCRRRRM